MDKLLYNAYRFSAANSARIENGNGNNNIGAIGADGRYGFDCSGFVYYLLKNSGYKIDSYASTGNTIKTNGDLKPEGAKWQETIAPSEARPGDLVYFQGHVGIVVSYDWETGTGVFRSSTSSYGVTDAPFTTNGVARKAYGGTYWGTGDKDFTAFTRVTATQDGSLNIWRTSTDTSTMPPLEAAPSLPSAANPSPSGYGNSFLTQTAWIESRSGDGKGYGVVNETIRKDPVTKENVVINTAVGRYQMLEKGGALTALGYTNADGTWMDKNGIKSREDFFKNPAEQERAAADYVALLRVKLIENGVLSDKYVGNTIGGHLITEEGLLGAAWQYGPTGLKQRLEMLDGPLDNNNVGQFGFLSRMDSFRGTLAPGMTGASVSAPTGGVADPYTGPVTNTPYPGTGTAIHHDDGSTTYMDEVKADSADGHYKKGDIVSTSYDKDPTNGINFSSETIRRTDGTVYERSLSADKSQVTIVEWSSDGVKTSQMTINRATGNFVGEVLVNGQRYDASGVPILPADYVGPDPVDINPGIFDAAPLPTEASIAQQVTSDWSGDNFGLADWDPTELLSGTQLGYLPGAQVDTASKLEADLIAQGYEVSRDDSGIYASKGEQYLSFTSDAMTFQNGSQWASIALDKNGIVISGSHLGTDILELHVDIAGTATVLRGHLSGNGDDLGDSAPDSFVTDQVISINGLSAAPLGTGIYDLSADDLQSFGFTFDKLFNGSVGQAGEALIAGMDPAAIQSNNWSPPQISSTVLDNGFTQTNVVLGNGVTLSTLRDDDRRVVSVTEIERTTPTDPNIQTITIRNAAGDITSTSSITQAVDSNPASATYGQSIANRYDIVNKDSAGSITGTAERVINPIDGSHADLNIGAATPDNPNGTLSYTATDATGKVTPLLSKDAQENLAQNAQSFNDAYALIKAIQNNQPLPTVTSGIALYNDIYHNAPPELLNASGALGALNSLYGLDQALGHGDVSGAVVSGANVFTQSVNTYVNVVYGDSINAAANGMGGIIGASNMVADKLPYLNIANDLAHGNTAAAIGDSVGLYVSRLADLGSAGGPVGAVVGLVIGAVLSDLFGHDSPPPPWGSAAAYWDSASGTIRINAVGISGGDAAAGSALTNLEGSLDNLTQQYNSQTQADFQIGIIPQRLGGISFSNQSYNISSIDPATGTSLNANLRFSASTGQSLNADASDPAYFQSMGQYYINNALARQAIAPEWEVQTAHQQAAHKLSNAGLSEVERAADLGHLVTALPADATTESWNPIGLDLGGGLATTSLAASSVQFNVDGTANLDTRITGTSSAQYLKQTAWLNSQDGFLVLDKNLNGSIDNAEELFSNSQVNTQSRGDASLATWDGDGNGAIDASDAVFSQLAVWQDSNGDGQVEQNEYHHLDELGITSLNYNLGTYTKADGSLHQMGTLTLQAQSEGHAYTAKADGIQIDSSTGQAQLLVTQVHDLSSVQANEDGFATDENVSAVIQLRGNGSTVQGLLDNDQVSNAPNALLSVTGVQNAQNGTVSLDASAGTVTFTPNVGFYGTAGFDYTVDAGAYGQTTAHVQVTAAHNDQAPHITGNQLTQIPLYGYTQVYSNPNGSIFQDNWTLSVVPVHQPDYVYDNPSCSGGVTYRSTPISYDSDPNSGVVSATDVDDPISSLTWSVVAQAHYGTASIDNSGHWSFSAGTNIGWNPSLGPFFGFVQPTSDAFQVQVKDPSGKTDTLTITVPLPPPPAPIDYGGGNPVILDLNETGFHFTAVNDSNVFQENATDGLRHHTAWFSGGNGVLAFDKFNDGIVHDSSQIAFKDYLPTAQTDLQGLAAFDSNHDGVIDKSDAQWSKLGAWVDTNQNGICEAGEYQTLDTLGIASVSLTSNNQFSISNGVTINGTTTFTRTDGTTGQVADTVLPTSSDVLATNADGTTRVTQVAQADPANPIIVGDGNNLVLGDKGDNIITAGNGNNVISTGTGNDVIQAGNGNNTIMSGDGKDLVVAGNGDNTIMLGAGPKTVVVGKGNNLVTGGSGNNIMMAGNGNNTLYAGSGNSVVYAGNGDNSMVGGMGRNELIAGNGNNLFTDGGGRADMTTGTGSNTFVVTNALDTITVSTAQGTTQGTNTVKTTVNWTLGANQQILWGTGSAALTLTGNDQGNQIIGNGAADTLIGGTGNDALADSGGAATLIGGQGDDTYIVSNTATVVTEAAGQGIDTVRSSVSYALGSNIENLTLVGINTINGTGNALDNVLTGNAASNVLMGGAGNDSYVLQIGGGRDTVIDNEGDSNSVLVRGNFTGADISLTRNGLDVIVGIKSSGDALILKNWFSSTAGQESTGAIESIRFDSGAPSLDRAYIHALLDNHAPSAVPDTANVNEDVALTATGNVLSNDTDPDAGDHLHVASATGTLQGTYGSLALTSDGSYTYTLNNSAVNVQALGRNAVVTDTFAYTVQDNGLNPLQANSTLTVSISGTNDAPVVNIDTAAVSEDGVLSATGNVLSNDSDVDAGDTLTALAPGILHGTYGDLVLAADGSYSYSLNNAAANVQALGRNAVVTDSFAYAATDGLATSASNLTVTVTGSNDAPVVTADTASVIEDRSVSATGNVLSNDSDVDAGDVLTVLTPGTLHGTYGDLVLATDGNYNYSLNNAAANVQSLRSGQTVTDSFAYAATDGLASSASNLTVTITGTNDTPVVTADTASVIEDRSVSATGNVLSNDSDVDAGDTLTVLTPGTLHGTYGDLVLAANGSYSYSLNNAAANVQSLRGGQTVTDSFAYEATDGMASSASNLTVTVTGSNDAPVAFADIATVSENAILQASGNVLVNDEAIDQGTVLSVVNAGTLAGEYGSLTLATDGSYTYTLNNSAANVQALSAGTLVNDVFSYTVQDNDPGNKTTNATLTVNIAGVNHSPIANADAADVTEDTATMATGNVLTNDRDADLGDTLTVLAPGTLHGTYGDLVLAANGSYSYSLNNAAANVQSLRGGQTVTDSFAYAATDGLATSASNLTVTVTGSNDAPVVTADTASVIEDLSVSATGNVLSNDSDVDTGDTLTVLAPGTLHGTYGDLVLATDGSYSYSLNNEAANVQALGRNEVVTDSFAYTATDGLATSASNLTVTITGTNDDPVVTADTASVIEDLSVSATGNVLSNDSDVDTADTLTIQAPGTLHGTYGDLVLAANGSYSYSLNNAAANVQSLRGGQTVTDSFAYEATDGMASSASNLTVTITGTNDAPVVTADTASVIEDLSISATGNVLSNDSDVDAGDTLTVLAPGTQHGTYGDLVLAADGSYRYSLNNAAANVQALGRNAVVTDTFAYTATDGLASAASNLTVTITGTNDTPVVTADTASVIEDRSVSATGNVLSNDSDIDAGDTLTVLAPGTLHGTYGDLVLAADGSYSYSLNNAACNVQSLRGGQIVTDSFAYAATDGLATSASNLTVTVTGSNDAPVVTADTAAVVEDLSVSATGNVLTNDSDVDTGDTLTILAPGTQHGTYGDLVLAADGSYSYSLNNAAANVQSLRGGQTVTDSFAYAATDGLASSASNLTVTITGTNDAPVAFADTASVKEDVTLTASGNVLSNDTDPDAGDHLHVASATGTLQGTYGSLALTSDGSYTYTLNNSAVNVQALGRNAVVTDTFAYTVQDNGLNPLQANSTLTVSISGTNDAPTVTVDTAAVVEDLRVSATGNVLSNDSDVDAGDTLAVLVPGTLHGTYGDLVLAANGSYSYSLNNAAANVQSLRGGQTVIDTFAYAATDGLATSASNLTVTVTGSNDGPVAIADTAAVKEDAALSASGNVLSNDSDPDAGDHLHVASATGTLQGTYGSLALASDGSYTYTLNNSAVNVQALGRNAVVTDTFAYTVQDNGLNPLQANSTLTVSISGTNDAPTVTVDTAAVVEDLRVTATGNVLSNDSDVDAGDALTILAPGTLHGTYGDLVLAANGSYSYSLNNAAANVQALGRNAVVTDTFAYTATDGLASAASKLTVTITGSNDAPVAFADTASVKEDATLTASGNVLTNDSDVDTGDTLTILAPGTLQGTYGDLTLQANGSYRYDLKNAQANVQTLHEGQQVVDSFNYTATDGLATSNATLNVTVTGTNDAPVAFADNGAVQEDATIPSTGNVLVNDVDLDQGTVLKVANVGAFTGQYGTLTLNANGAYSYVLNNALATVQSLSVGQTVVDQFSYTVQDDGLQPMTASSTLAITITGTNDVPTVVSAIGAQAAREKQAFSYTVPVNTFADVDNGDVLTYSALAVNAAGATQALPNWLSFNATTRTFSGTPGSADGGSFDFQVTATDRSGASVSTRFTVDISDEFAGTGSNLNVITGSWTNDTLNGTSRSETLIGNGGTDKLLAGEGNNTIISTGGDTLITAGAGNDDITSSYGNDTIYAGDGNNRINAGGGNNFIVAGKGDDYITTDWGFSTINAGEGNNTIVANGDGTVVASAGSGDDTITTSYGNDTINAGDGNNRINAGGGNNVITAGSGNDTITTDWGISTINAGDGNNTIIATGGSTMVTTGSGADTITTSYGNDVVNSGAGNDIISTGWGSDTIDAGAGDDFINAGGGGDSVRGGLGNDTIIADQWSDDKYYFARGDGQDRVTDSGGQDTLVLEDITSSQLWFTHTGNDLNVSVIGTTDSVTLKNWYVGAQYPGSQYHVEQFKTSDGKTLTDTNVQSLVQAMASFAPPASGQITLPTNYATTLSPVIAANWK